MGGAMIGKVTEIDEPFRPVVLSCTVKVMISVLPTASSVLGALYVEQTVLTPVDVNVVVFGDIEPYWVPNPTVMLLPFFADAVTQMFG